MDATQEPGAILRDARKGALLRIRTSLACPRSVAGRSVNSRSLAEEAIA
jgi:hypothetical protein